MAALTHVSSAAGSTLGAVFGVAARVRGTKPLHPHGSVVPAVLEREGGGDWQVPWLDEPGTDDCRVRFSRSLGLPSPLPDVLGLGLSFEGPAGRSDLLLATTGSVPLARHLLLPRRDERAAAYGSLFTYSTPRGRVVLGALPRADAEHDFDVVVATSLGAWQRFGLLRLKAEVATSPDAPLDLDPVLHPLPGLPLSPVLARLREPSYAAARSGRGA